MFVGDYGLNHGSSLKGVMLWASYLTKGHALKDYPTPVLTISGDLDGLTRITRIVDTFEYAYSFNPKTSCHASEPNVKNRKDYVLKTVLE